MSREERAAEIRRPFARDEAAASPERAATREQRDGAEQREVREQRAALKHAQMVFVTPLGIPIGPSVQEELSIPDDLDDALPPGDFPGQLLLDLGLR